jgi:hypothetical protein
MKYKRILVGLTPKRGKAYLRVFPIFPLHFPKILSQMITYGNLSSSRGKLSTKSGRIKETSIKNQKQKQKTPMSMVIS